jgi:uncharacterized protein (DUF111 family)
LLEIDRIACSTLEVGGGTVKCAHGVMPVPAPATARLLEGVPFSSGATDKECTTPTGATLLIGKACAFGTRLRGTQLKTAIATGQRDDPNLPNALYLSLFETAGDSPAPESNETIWELAANMDDMTAEALAFLCEAIMEEGALDCWQSPATFKKGRLGSVVHALVTEDQIQSIEACFFKHSRTLGVRRKPWERSILQRESQTLDTPYGSVRIKTAQLPDGSTRRKIEYEDAARIAREQKQCLEWVHAQIDSLLTDPES